MFVEVVMLIEIVLPSNGLCFLSIDSNVEGGNGFSCSRAAIKTHRLDSVLYSRKQQAVAGLV